jgi:Methyltransferase domain
MRVTTFYYTTDPDQAGYSLANFAELWRPCFDAIGARSVVEVGAERGRLTAALLDWAAGSGARVTAIEPAPLEELLEMSEAHPELELVRETSLEAFTHIPVPDVVMLDGDHNYYTLSGELRLIAERAPAGEMPLLIFHDVCWPLARRDQYFVPDRIPEEERHPMGEDVRVVPRNPGVAEHGLPFEWAALEAGGPRNGVMTAIEDFTAERGGLRLAVVPIFFGCGILWREDAPWSDAVAEILEPWDRNPLLERLEETRVAQLVLRHSREQELDEQLRRYSKLEELLKRMLGSGSFTAGEWLSRLHSRGRPAFSREQVRRALEENDGQR